MDRDEALRRLRSLEGQDFRRLAEQYGVTVRKEGRLNKGWAGQTVERFLGRVQDSSRAPDFGDWELKVTSLKRGPGGRLVPKETVAITMIDPVDVVRTDFENSHLLNKLGTIVLVARIFEGQDERRSCFHSAQAFDLTDPHLRAAVREDYELVRSTIRTAGFEALTGAMGRFVQPRTKGQGHGSSTRAFYARKNLVARILGISS
jgi:DNA mismatch repair protein MutH